ncbi:MAG: hypothetical protein ACKVPX_10055 [Myxococcaceae bacterium]
MRMEYPAAYLSHSADRYLVTLQNVPRHKALLMESALLEAMRAIDPAGKYQVVFC